MVLYVCRSIAESQSNNQILILKRLIKDADKEKKLQKRKNNGSERDSLTKSGHKIHKKKTVQLLLPSSISVIFELIVRTETALAKIEQTSLTFIAKQTTS